MTLPPSIAWGSEHVYKLEVDIEHLPMLHGIVEEASPP
jgi:hypothetical protein